MNVGLVDAIIRFVAGWVFIHLTTVLKVEISPLVKWILIIIGIILVVTSITRHCSIYSLFKISTYR